MPRHHANRCFEPKVLLVPVAPRPKKFIQDKTCPLTVTVDTLHLWVLGSWATLLLIIRDALLQFNHQPVVAAGVFARYCLHQVGAVARPTSRLIDDLPLPQFEAYRGTTGI